ncbi:hypothetical protein [Streptomyces corynorhini]|nr:hypothetical protein [Streptomyces corynorhini]
MAPLRKDMPTRDPDWAAKNPGHETTYGASRGGWVKPPKTPTPPAPKTGR